MTATIRKLLGLIAVLPLLCLAMTASSQVFVQAIAGKRKKGSFSLLSG